MNTPLPVDDALRERIAAALAPAYTIEHELGRGGMSVVYRAMDTRLHRAVAIKVLPPELAFVSTVRARFLREAQTAAQLSHPNIVPIYDVQEQDGLVWIVMALIDGETLGARLHREGTIAGPETARILAAVCDALASAHAHAVIHRDIKPDNILLERGTGRVLVTDFGIARAAEGDARLTATGIAVGTPTYMSPEQALGEGEVDGRADLYALGVVGYHMLAGAPPFSATSTPALLLKHVSEPPPPLSSRAPAAPRPLVRTIEQAMAKKPADRFADAPAMAAALREEAPARAVGEHRRVELPPAMLEPPRRIPRLRPENEVTTRPEERHAARASRADAQLDRARGGALPVPPRPPADLGAVGVPSWSYNAPAGAQTVAAYAEDFRRRAVSRGMAMLFILGVNVLTGGPPWAIFPLMGIALSLRARFRPLADAGFSMRDVLTGGAAAVNGSPAAVAPVRLMSESFVGRARRFVRRAKVAIVGAGTAVIAGVVGSLSPGIQEPLGALMGVSIFATIVTAIGALRASGPLVSAGFTRRALWNGTWRDSDAARVPAVAYRLREEEVAQLAAPEVVMSPLGDRLRLAVDDRTAIRHQLARLDAASAGVLGEVMPVANGLVERVVSLCAELHRMNRDVGASDDAAVTARIAQLRAQGAAADDRTIALLERQRASLAELDARRDRIRTQLDSASLALQNLRLDVLRLGELGAPSAVETAAERRADATQQARALSKDLAYLLDGYRDVSRS